MNSKSHTLLWIWVALAIVSSSCSILPRNWTRKTKFDERDLKSENPVVQVQAIKSVVAMQDKRQISFLIDLMLDENPSVRNHAYWAVTQLSPAFTQSVPEYRFYDTSDDLKRIVKIWKEKWQGGKFSGSER